MSALTISVLTFCCVFASALAGLWLRERLPEHHLSKGSEDTVKLVAGLLATLSALVLGLLIASAKQSFDTVNDDLKQGIARIIVIDRLLADYGPEADGVRQRLKQQTLDLYGRLLSGGQSAEAVTGAATPSVVAGGVQVELLRLAPRDAAHAALLNRIEQLSDDVRQKHWQLFEQADDSVPGVFLVVIVSWLAAMFLSFGLFSPRNPTTVTAMAIAAVAVATAIFLMQEMYRPLDGLIAIPRAPIQAALALLGR